MSIDSLRWEVPPPLPPKRRLKSSFDDVPPPLPVKRSVTRTSKLMYINNNYNLIVVLILLANC